MTNHMSEVAKLLGVELGEEFELKEGNGCVYRITEYGLTCNGCYDPDILMLILIGSRTIKRKPQKPNKGEEYWTVRRDRTLFNCKWNDDMIDAYCYKLGNCYSTKEEAEANRDKWLAFYAQAEVLEV